MKYILATHIDGKDEKVRFWKVPAHLEGTPIVEKKTKANVNTKHGIQQVLVVKVLEQEKPEVFDKFKNKTFVPRQEVVDFVV